jgi:hypothetical protein
VKVASFRATAPPTTFVRVVTNSGLAEAQPTMPCTALLIPVAKYPKQDQRDLGISDTISIPESGNGPHAHLNGAPLWSIFKQTTTPRRFRI